MSNEKPIGHGIDDDQQESPKPKTMKEVLAVMGGNQVEAQSESEPLEQGEPDTGEEEPVDSGTGVPAWVTVPEGNFQFPNGRIITFVRFYPQITGRMELGERNAILWTLSVADERNAIKRSRGEPARMLPEQAMAQIRSIDGLRVDWTGRPVAGKSYSVEKFWEEIGPKYRQQLQHLYIKLHGMTDVESLDFFTHCVAIRSGAESVTQAVGSADSTAKPPTPTR